jgi:FMN phosphatase YigB (HAD superfamily)
MALTLPQYANYLDTRDLPWPAPPPVDPPKAKPHLVPLPDVRAVTWSIYGTLLAIAGGEFVFEHPDDFVMDVALDKTIQEFKMWGAMPRKPGQPTDYLRKVYRTLLTEQRTQPGHAEKYPEVLADRLWEAYIKRLLQKDYSFDAGFYGSLNAFSAKVAYFFHASLQGTACYKAAATALRRLKKRGIALGLLANTQCFTLVQLERALMRQDSRATIDALFDADARALSHELLVRKPSERLFRRVLTAFAQRGITPGQVLHIGASVTEDVIPARRHGMKAGLFAGDKASLRATKEQLREGSARPHVLLTELGQIALVVGGGAVPKRGPAV